MQSVEAGREPDGGHRRDVLRGGAHGARSV